MEDIKQVVEQKLLMSRNDKNIAPFIMSFLPEHQCQKCYKHVEKSQDLYVTMSFTRGTYNFRNIKGSNYCLKKFCKDCCRSKASSVPIYVEIN